MLHHDRTRPIAATVVPTRRGDVPVSPEPLTCTVCSQRNFDEQRHLGSTGQLNVWLLAGTRNETACRRYGPLGNFDNWTKVETCVTATTPHSTIRVQFYADAFAPTVNIDDVDARVPCLSGFCHDTVGVGI
jgi:hypothetical protein